MKPLLLCLAGALCAQAQTSEEGIRQLWNSQFLDKRPPAKTTAATAAKPKPAVYKSVPSASTTKAAVKSSRPASPNDTLVGLTLWLLRKPRATDDPNSRLLILEDDTSNTGELVPERLDAESPVKEGDRVRITVEVPRTGYLYVIDREQYVDGTVSPAYLIYPNHKTKQGDNAVAAGRVVEIPDQRDKPNHLTVRRSRPDQSAELLSLLVTPEPLPNLKIGTKPVKISEEQFAGWEKQFGVQVERFELTGAAGATYTKAEKEAGANTEKLLTQNDPFPQTLYRVEAAPGKPLLFNLPVRIKQ
ncbi:MAG: DUF4384 domain-containing protein [Acidobacteriia bacterium]|nr:DUF4384 domain-containing protein [Terriglobia bacterium]